MHIHRTMPNQPAPATLAAIEKLRTVLAAYPDIVLALLFGSMAAGTATAESDLDLAVAASKPLSAIRRLALMDDLALAFGRPVDLVDLTTAGEPLRGQIISGGIKILGAESAYGDLLYRHIVDSTDFLPYRERILAERRRRWIGH